LDLGSGPFGEGKDVALRAVVVGGGIGEVGEVVVRGDVVMAGYWNQLRDRLRAETADGGSL